MGTEWVNRAWWGSNERLVVPRRNRRSVDSAVHGQTGEGNQGRDGGRILPFWRDALKPFLQWQLLPWVSLWPLFSFDQIRQQKNRHHMDPLYLYRIWHNLRLRKASEFVFISSPTNLVFHPLLEPQSPELRSGPQPKSSHSWYGKLLGFTRPERKWAWTTENLDWPDLPKILKTMLELIKLHFIRCKGR